jgi:hypothetical protein
MGVLPFARWRDLAHGDSVSDNQREALITLCLENLKSFRLRTNKELLTMLTTPKRIGFLLVPAMLVLGWAGAETITVNSGRPVADAARKLEARYNRAITYEDPANAYAGDLEDANAPQRRAAREAGRPEGHVLMTPRAVSFTFTLADGPRAMDDGPRTMTRAPETTTREAILTMLRSYSASLGGIETFTLTDSNGLFHIVPTQIKNAAGVFETSTPLLDRTVTIPPGQRNGQDLVKQICRSLSEQSGAKVSPGAGPSNQLIQHLTSISSMPNETARSILSRLFAELRRPASWELRYGLDGPEDSGLYVLNVYLVETAGY